MNTSSNNSNSRGNRNDELGENIWSLVNTSAFWHCPTGDIYSLNTANRYYLIMHIRIGFYHSGPSFTLNKNYIFFRNTSPPSKRTENIKLSKCACFNNFSFFSNKVSSLQLESPWKSPSGAHHTAAVLLILNFLAIRKASLSGQHF